MNEEEHARFIMLESLVSKLVAKQPDAAEIVDAFEAFAAQQIAMQAALGGQASFVDALRTELANLLRLVRSPKPSEPD